MADIFNIDITSANAELVLVLSILNMPAIIPASLCYYERKR